MACYHALATPAYEEGYWLCGAADAVSMAVSRAEGSAGHENQFVWVCRAIRSLGHKGPGLDLQEAAALAEQATAAGLQTPEEWLDVLLARADVCRWQGERAVEATRAAFQAAQVQMQVLPAKGPCLHVYRLRGSVEQPKCQLWRACDQVDVCMSCSSLLHHACAPTAAVSLGLQLKVNRHRLPGQSGWTGGCSCQPTGLSGRRAQQATCALLVPCGRLHSRDLWASEPLTSLCWICRNKH